MSRGDRGRHGGRGSRGRHRAGRGGPRSGAAVLLAAAVIAAAGTGVAWSLRTTPNPPTVAAATTGAAVSVSTSASTSPSPTSTAPARNWVEQENALPGDKGWQITTGAGELELSGYADQVSVAPGEKLTLRVTSTLGAVDIAAYRLGWYAGAQGRRVWSRDDVPVEEQPPPTVSDDGMVETDWKPTLDIATTDFPEGTYLITLRAQGKAAWIPVTVRSMETAGRLVLVNAVATYQAYNTWGGRSLYKGSDGGFGTRARRVSFDRPYDQKGAGTLLTQEQRSIAFAEQLGLDLAYTTSLDLHLGRPDLTTAAGVVTLGHDEYWTVEMRTHVEAARDAGVNLAFLGANAAYWRVRFDAGLLGPNRTLVGYKSPTEDPVQGTGTTNLFRQGPSPWPENSFVGMLYECYPASGDLRVHDGTFFLFDGTDLKTDDVVPGLVGIEIDRAYPIRGTPENLQVVAHSPVACAGLAPTHSDMTYYTTASGAGVFATGNMLFTRSLFAPNTKRGQTEATVAFTRTVTENLLRAMAAGPMGTDHPAKGNLSELPASPSTTTGTGFIVDPNWLAGA